MLNCVLNTKGRKGCMNLHSGYYGKCALSYVSGHVLQGKESCDQYKEEPRRCDACSADVESGGHYVVSGNVLCVHCHALYDCLIRGKQRSHGHTAAMDILKELVKREGEAWQKVEG